MTAHIFAGIDPGPSWTGIVARCTTDPMTAISPEVVENDRPKTGHGVTDVYLDAVSDAVLVMLTRLSITHPGIPVTLAVEGVNVPSGFPDKRGQRRFVAPRDMIGLGIVYGWVRGQHPDAVVVPPDHHGYGMLGSYPDALITAGERRGGLDRIAPQNSKLRHARSAWDVTLSAARTARTGVLL